MFLRWYHWLACWREGAGRSGGREIPDGTYCSIWLLSPNVFLQVYQEAQLGRRRPIKPSWLRARRTTTPMVAMGSLRPTGGLSCFSSARWWWTKCIMHQQMITIGFRSPTWRKEEEWDRPFFTWKKEHWKYVHSTWTILQLISHRHRSYQLLSVLTSEPTCGWMVRGTMVSPPHQGSNSGARSGRRCSRRRRGADPVFWRCS